MNANPLTPLCRAARLSQRVLSWLAIAGAIAALPVPALTINATFDSSITTHPRAADIQATINSAIAFYEDSFSDPITASIKFQNMDTGLGGSTTWRMTFSYTEYLAALKAHATTEDDATALAHLPAGPHNPVNGDDNVLLKLPLARALGFSAAPSPGNFDGVISLHLGIINISSTDTDASKYSLYAVVCHEIDEVLATGSLLDGVTNGAPVPTGAVSAEDLFRYDQNGVRGLSTAFAAEVYFSLDGTNELVRFNQAASGDFGDWYSPSWPTPQVQDAFMTPGATPVPVLELRVLDALGFNRVPAVVYAAFGGTDPGIGTYQQPFNALAGGVAGVRPNGTVVIKGPGSTSETLTISKAMTITAIGGPATIGR